MPVHRLFGPSAAPLSGGPARQLVVLLHGVGADGADLMALAPILAEALPDAAFIGPDAPFAYDMGLPYDMAPSGRQWFSLTDRTPAKLGAGVRMVAPSLDAFLDEQLAHHHLEDAALAVIGFSQGCMMALHVMPRRPRPCAAVVGFSGALIEPERLAGEVRSRPRILVVHGESDDVVNPACLAQAESALAAVGIPVQSEMRPGLGHSIDALGLALAGAVMRQAFGLEA